MQKRGNLKIAFTIPLILIIIACRHPGEQSLEVKFNLHTRSAESLHIWFNDPSNKKYIKQLVEHPGNQIMAEIVRDSLKQHDLPAFSDQLYEFSRDHSLNTDPYGINLAWLQRERTILLLQNIKNHNFAYQTVERIKPYIPNDSSLQVTCDVYFVLTGWEWGDAMVEKVKKIGDKYKIARNGEPVIIFNLSIITNLYEKKGYNLINHLSHSMTHELFHLVFAKYKEISPRWKNKKDTTPTDSLVELIQNEGIAHYISHDQREKLISGYNKSTDYKEHERDAFNQLESAVKLLSNPDASKKKKDELLMKADAGRFWSKYGAISGMFMAYHIERKLGKAAIKESIAGGANLFLEKYDKVQIANPELPVLPLELKRKIKSQE